MEFRLLGPVDITPQHRGRANRILNQIEELNTLRGQAASDEPTTLILSAATGTGKTMVTVRGLLGSLKTRSPQPRLLRAGSTVAINAEAIEATRLPDGITPRITDLVAISPAARRPPVAVLPPYRVVPQWLRHAAFAPVTVDLRLVDEMHTPIDLASSFEEPEPVTLLVHLAQLSQLHEGVLQLFDGILTTLRFALTLVLAAFRRRPDVRNLTLVLVAASRRFGRRSEPDDRALPAHRWMSVIGGEPALSC